MYIIGVTGGVGCGKSEVLRYLSEKWGVRILQLDLIGHSLLEPDSPCYKRIADLFGPAAVNADGTLNRGVIGESVFHDEAMRQALDDILHPAIRRKTDAILKQLREEGVPAAAVEAALLLEAKYDAICDETWYIYADESVRTGRLILSRGYSEERIRGMMAAQMKEEEFRAACSFVIDNSGAFERTERQIDGRMRDILHKIKE